MHTKTDIILYGGGGHCVSVIDVIETTGLWRIAGIVDIKEKLGQKVCGYEIIGSDDDIPALAKQYEHFIITVGQIATAAKRIQLYNAVKNTGAALPVIISPLAHVSTHARVGEGTVVLHHAVINAGATTGVNCIINTKALLEHTVSVGDHCHISTGSLLNGDVQVGSGCFIGSGAVLKNGIVIGDNAIVGAGSVVLENIPSSTIVAGNPARNIKS